MKNEASSEFDFRQEIHQKTEIKPHLGSTLALECPLCTLEWDHTGKAINGDERCLNLDGDLADLSQECTGNGVNPQLTCETRLNSIWNMNGKMEFRLRRSCNSYSTAT